MTLPHSHEQRNIVPSFLSRASRAITVSRPSFLPIMVAACALLLSNGIIARANDISNSSWAEQDASNNQSPPAGWPAGMAPNQVEPAARAMMGAIKRWYDHTQPTVTSGGSANAQTLTYSVAPAAYVAGDTYTFIAGFSNTGATTLNVNSLGAITVQSAGSALTGGEIYAGRPISVYYDGTNFQLIATISSPWSAMVFQNGGGSSTGHNLVWADQNPFFNNVNYLAVGNTDKSELNRATMTGSATNGDTYGFDVTLQNISAGCNKTFNVRATAGTGDSLATLASKLNTALTGSGIDACLALIGPPSYQLSNGVSASTGVVFDLPWSYYTSLTAVSGATETVTMGTPHLDNGPLLKCQRDTTGRTSVVGDQLCRLTFEGTSSGGTGIDTAYGEVYVKILTPDATNPAGEMVFSVATTTSGKSFIDQLMISNGVSTADNSGTGANCGLNPGAGVLLTCGLIVTGTKQPQTSFQAAASTDVLIDINPATAGQNGAIQFKDSGTLKFQLLKTTGNLFEIYDAPNNGLALKVDTSGNTTVGESGKTLTAGGPMVLASYAVASLPSCGSSQKGDLALANDQNGSPTYRGSLTGGGSLVVIAMCNGTSWEAH